VALRHPRHELDDLLGHPVRFSLVALLAAASKVEFSFVRDQLEVTDSMLSKQVSGLEQVGYVKVHKAFVGKRPRTWLSLTREGRRTFERHLAALREIAQNENGHLPSGGEGGAHRRMGTSKQAQTREHKW
jgi:DNA-binding MarR family transcriptional regulator